MLGDRIVESLGPIKRSFSRLPPRRNTLNYRFKKGSGEWIWLQHCVYNLSYDNSGKPDKVLHRLRLLDTLFAAAEQTVPVYKIGLNELSSEKLTSREKQVLKLIAEGLSTKMIAGKLKISINTVETHRRHLLVKLDAKNSMELIKKAFRLFWN